MTAHRGTDDHEVVILCNAKDCPYRFTARAYWAETARNIASTWGWHVGDGSLGSSDYCPAHKGNR